MYWLVNLLIKLSMFRSVWGPAPLVIYWRPLGGACPRLRTTELEAAKRTIFPFIRCWKQMKIQQAPPILMNPPPHQAFLDLICGGFYNHESQTENRNVQNTLFNHCVLPFQENVQWTIRLHNTCFLPMLYACLMSGSSVTKNENMKCMNK